MRPCLSIFATLCVAATSYGLPQMPGSGPKFAETYTASGYILLPYAELVEPFVAYYDGPNKMSRIDYYEGEMKTFQIAKPYKDVKTGASYKVVWSPNKDTHVPEQTCYQAVGADPAGGDIATQNILPNLSDFKFVKTENCEVESTTILRNVIKATEKCYRYEKTSVNFGRKSTYTFWATQDEDGQAVPVRYLMMGYDSLLGSHYDKYEIIYTNYQPGDVNGDNFDVMRIVEKCVPYPDGSGLSVGHLFNPMKEFIHHDESHLDSHFDLFKSTHGKQYENEREEQQKKDNFRHNLRFVNSQNRRNLTYALKVNHMADWGRNDFKLIRGRQSTVNKQNNGRAFPREKFYSRGLPEYVDWRLEGAVTPVKDQAICGSCWSFGTVGHIEGMYFIKNGELVRFAEQELVDCSWNDGNGACDGGLDFQAYHYIAKYGLATDEQYGAYKGIDGKCHDTQITGKPIKTIKGYYNVSGVEDLRKAIAFVGPISVAIDASHPSLSFYSHGVYKEPACGNKPENLDHAVLAVGYGTLRGEPYWLIKNSWSTYWGNDGYVLMSQDNNMCGVATQATYVEL